MADFKINKQSSNPSFYDVLSPNGQNYIYVPKEYVNSGFIEDGTQNYSEAFLNPNVFKNALLINLPDDSGIGSDAKRFYKNPTEGYLWKKDDLYNIVGKLSPIGDIRIPQYSYKISSTKPAIVGLSQDAGVPSYFIGQTANTDRSFIQEGGVVQGYIDPKNDDGGGFFNQLFKGNIGGAFASLDPSASISRAATSLFQPVEQAVTTNLAQLDKDLSLSQNAPLIATIAATIALPGVGASIGQQMLSAGLLPVGTSVATATAVGTGLANAALQVAQGKPVEDALKAGVVGAAGGAVGSYLVGDPGTLKNFVTSTSTNLLAGKNPEDAVKAGITSSGAGLAGSTVAGETGSAVAGQVAAGTTAGVLSGKTVEQSLAQGVGNIKLDSLIPDTRLIQSIDLGKSGDLLGQINLQRNIVGLDAYKSIDDYYTQNEITPPGVTVSNEAQVTAGQQDLINQLAPYESTIPPSTTAFDTTSDISDTSGFSVSQPTTPITSIPTTPITGNTGGNMATYDDEMNAPATELEDTTPYEYSPEEQAQIYQINQEIAGTYTSSEITKAIEDYSKGTGLTIDKVVKFFKDNPNLAKAATSVIAKGVGLFGTKLATDTATEAAKAAADAMKFKPVGVTTRFGTTDYTYDDKGNLATAGYTLTPELKAIQDKLMSGVTLSLDEAKKVADLYDPLKKASSSLFDLGTSYLAKTPEQVAADYMAKQQDLLAPSRERQMSQLQNTLFQQGRGGLSVGATSARPSGARGLGATTPEMEAYYNALAQQDASLAAGAQQAGQQSVLFGKGLLGAGGEFLGKYTAGQTSAYDPFKTLLSTAGAVEGMGAGALDVGTALGGRTTTASSNAARTIQPSASYNPYGNLFSGIGNDPQFQRALQDFISGGGLKP